MSNYLRTIFLRSLLRPNLSPLSETIATATNVTTNSTKSNLLLSNSLKAKLFNNSNFTTFSKLSSPKINNFKLPLFNIRQFSTAVQNEADKNLAIHLDDEIKFEKKERPLENEPEFIKEFLSVHSFKIKDKSGSNEITLTRTFGNENIRILFDISMSGETESVDEDSDDYDSDDENRVQYDEDTKGTAIRLSATRCNITVEKTGHGALGFDTLVSDGIFIINHVTYYKDSDLPYDVSAEADWKRRGLFPGPDFDSLDPELQILFEKYLEERGIDTAVALFIQNYVEHKEQIEYVAWLEKVKKFVESP